MKKHNTAVQGRDLLWRVYVRIYEAFRFGAFRLLGKPLLLIKIGDASLGNRIRTTITRLLFTNQKDLIIRTHFGALLYIPKGCMETYRYIMQYEPEVTRLVSEFLRPGMTMVDIGAHIGYYTLLAKIKVGEKGQVFAFEPDPKFFYALTQSLKLNKITIGVHLYQMAIADRNGFSSFFAHPSGSGSNLYASFPGSRSITVETITLDTFFEKVGWSKVDLIKIDVEGAELAVLRGMEELNRRNKSLRLIVEFAAKRRSGVQPEEFFNTLQRLGFTRVLAIEKPSLHKPEEIIREAARVGYLNLFCEKET